MVARVHTRSHMHIIHYTRIHNTHKLIIFAYFNIYCHYACGALRPRETIQGPAAVGDLMKFLYGNKRF